MLKALAGPYALLNFMPTGGITIQTLSEYLSLSNVIACGGSWIAPEKLIDGGEFQIITKMAQEAVDCVQKTR